MKRWTSYQNTEYKGGREDSLTVFCYDLVNRIDIGKASIVVVDGAVGEGKTTMSIHIGDFINEVRGYPEINFSGNQYSFGGTRFILKLISCYEEKFPVLIYDEAGDYNRRNSLAEFNKNINRVFEMFRAFKVLIIIALPSFAVLDKNLFLNGCVRGLIHLHSRTGDKGRYSVYDIDKMNWIAEYMKNTPTKTLAYQKVWPSFEGEFYNLSPERSEKLDKVITGEKVQALKDIHIQQEGLINKEQIGMKVGRTKEYVHNILRKFNIEPDKYINKKAYYREEVVEKVKEYLTSLKDGKAIMI